MKIFYGKQSIDNLDIQSIVKASKSEKITQGDFVSKFENSLKKILNPNIALLYQMVQPHYIYQLKV